MSAVKHAIQFIAVMGPNQEHVAPKDLAVTLTEAFPNCRVDWEAGDEFTRENVAKLESMGISDMMLEGARSFMGNRFVLRVKPVSEVPGGLSGVVSTVHRDLGDSLGFKMDPYVPQHLHTLAEALAGAIDFRYHLSYAESFSVHVNPFPCPDPLEIAKRHLPIPLGDDPDIQIHRLFDWESTFHAALQQWLELSGHKNKFNDATRSFATLADYAAAAVNDLQGIAPPLKAWVVDVPDWSHQNAMLLAQANCYTYISLSGVPKGILGISNR